MRRVELPFIENVCSLHRDCFVLLCFINSQGHDLIYSTSHLWTETSSSAELIVNVNSTLFNDLIFGTGDWQLSLHDEKKQSVKSQQWLFYVWNNTAHSPRFTTSLYIIEWLYLFIAVINNVIVNQTEVIFRHDPAAVRWKYTVLLVGVTTNKCWLNTIIKGSCKWLSTGCGCFYASGNVITKHWHHKVIIVFRWIKDGDCKWTLQNTRLMWVCDWTIRRTRNWNGFTVVLIGLSCLYEFSLEGQYPNK